LGSVGRREGVGGHCPHLAKEVASSESLPTLCCYHANTTKDILRARHRPKQSIQRECMGKKDAELLGVQGEWRRKILYSFPKSVIINYYQLGGFKQQKFQSRF
jgi:hypothetical protein